MLLLASMMTSEGVWRFVALPWMIVFGVRFPPWLGLLYWVTEAFPEFATHRFPAISNPRPRGKESLRTANRRHRGDVPVRVLGEDEDRRGTGAAIRARVAAIRDVDVQRRVDGDPRDDAELGIAPADRKRRRDVPLRADGEDGDRRAVRRRIVVRYVEVVIAVEGHRDGSVELRRAPLNRVRRDRIGARTGGEDRDLILARIRDEDRPGGEGNGRRLRPGNHLSLAAGGERRRNGDEPEKEKRTEERNASYHAHPLPGADRRVLCNEAPGPGVGANRRVAPKKPIEERTAYEREEPDPFHGDRRADSEIDGASGADAVEREDERVLLASDPVNTPSTFALDVGEGTIERGFVVCIGEMTRGDDRVLNGDVDPLRGDRGHRMGGVADEEQTGAPPGGDDLARDREQDGFGAAFELVSQEPRRLRRGSPDQLVTAGPGRVFGDEPADLQSPSARRKGDREIRSFDLHVDEIVRRAGCARREPQQVVGDARRGELDSGRSADGREAAVASDDEPGIDGHPHPGAIGSLEPGDPSAAISQRFERRSEDDLGRCAPRLVGEDFEQERS